MTQLEKVTFVIDTLNKLYPQVPIPLDHKDPYTLLIAVLLSAQSTDVRVNQITPLLFEIADNPYDMVKLTVGKWEKWSFQFGYKAILDNRKFPSRYQPSIVGW